MMAGSEIVVDGVTVGVAVGATVGVICGLPRSTPHNMVVLRDRSVVLFVVMLQSSGGPLQSSV
jgi:hypothetical protein